MLAVAIHVWLIPAMVLICASIHDMRNATWYDRCRFMALVWTWPVSFPALFVLRWWNNRRGAKKG